MKFIIANVLRLRLREANAFPSHNLVIDNNRAIKELEKGKTHKYLWIEEREGIHQQIKDRLKQKYNRRLRIILKSELNARNKITEIGALAVPVLRYSFGIINWRLEEIKQIDRKIIKMLTMYKMHHPKVDMDRLYVKGKKGGRGLVQVEAVYKTEVIHIAEYRNTKYKGYQL
jgi:hypothetical protein